MKLNGTSSWYHQVNICTGKPLSGGGGVYLEEWQQNKNCLSHCLRCVCKRDSYFLTKVEFKSLRCTPKWNRNNLQTPKIWQEHADHTPCNASYVYNSLPLIQWRADTQWGKIGPPEMSASAEEEEKRKKESPLPQKTKKEKKSLPSPKKLTNKQKTNDLILYITSSHLSIPVNI